LDSVIKEVGKVLFANEKIKLINNSILNELGDKTADELRDASLYFEKLSVPLALTLMEEALKRRPDGPFIQSKVAQYKEYILLTDILKVEPLTQHLLKNVISKFNLSNHGSIYSFSQRVKDEYPELSFELLWLSHLKQPQNKQYIEAVKSHAKDLGIQLFYDQRVAQVTRLYDYTETAYERSEAYDTFVSKEVFGGELAEALVGECNLPKSLLEQAIIKGFLEFICPYTGIKLKSSSMISENLFVFGEGEGRFYVSFQLEPLFQQPISTLFVFMPKKNQIILHDFAKSRKPFPYTKNNIPRMLNSTFKKVVTNYLDDSFVVNTTAKNVVITSRGLNHIGHSLWNELSVYSSLLDYNKLYSLNPDITVAFCNNFYLTGKEMIAFFNFKGTVSCHEVYADVLKYYENELVLTLSHDFISRQFVESLLRYSYGLDIQKVNVQNKVILSLRTGKRSCKNEAEVYIKLIKEVRKVRPDTEFIIDGVNVIPQRLDSNSGDVKRLDGHHEDELNIAKYIMSSVGGSANVTICVAKELSESLKLISQSCCVISPWGAGLVKYRWLLDKKVFIYGSEITLDDSHIHKDLYDSNEFIKSVNVSSYYSGDSTYIDEKSKNREASYIVDEEAFVIEAKCFILNSLEKE